MSSSSGAGANGGGAANAAAPANDGGTDWSKLISRGVVMYFAFNAASKMLDNYLKKQSGARQGQTEVHETVEQVASPSSSIQQPFTAPPLFRIKQDSLASLFWAPSVPLDFYVFLSSASAPSNADIATQISPLVPGSSASPELSSIFDTQEYTSLLANDGIYPQGEWTIVEPSASLPALKLSAVPLNERKLKQGYAADITIKTPHDVMHSNGSIWADIVAVKYGDDPFTTPHKARARKMLTRLYPSRRGRQGKRLVGGKSEPSDEEDEEDEDEDDEEKSTASPSSLLSALTGPKKLVTYWHKNLTIAIPEQDDNAPTPLGRLPPPLLQHVHVAKGEDGELYVDETTGHLKNFPVLFPNTFWDLRGDMNPINGTTPTLDLHVQLYVTSWFKFQMLAALSDSFEKQQGMAGSEVDMIKSTLMNTSPWYLALMAVVTLLHMLFEFLAFSSDVKHWKSKENLAGVSVGSIATNIATQTIILLYLFDSSEDTSWMILGSQAIGVVIEAWKLTKAITVNIKPRAVGSKSWLPYELDVQDKHVLSAEEKETQQYDRLAFKLVAIVTAPLLGGYTIYSAIYNEHRGWWSFIIGTLCSFVYSFGFVSLVPQIIINYKLKSVAGLNGKTLIYKVLTTFVDDVFAFAVPMPTLHRLATLRDDVIFFVYLYQWWTYGVDKTRVNEFGQVADVDALKAKKEIQGSEDSEKESKKDQ